jgi:transposase
MSQENSASKQPLIRYVNRQQMSWRAVDVEKLIGEDHPARAIWELVGGLDLSSFYAGIESNVAEGGRPAFDPQLLISLWVYAYSQGIGSAREVARRCEYDPAFQWLTGLQEVNYHTLADFRVEKQKELDELFTQVLAALSKEGLITLEQVMQDGTKVKALASGRSFQQEESIREHLECARQRVREMGDPRDEEISSRTRSTRQRVREQQRRRLERALQEVQKLQQQKHGSAKKANKVSINDPEARFMKQPDGGLAPSYNVQISADAAQGIIVGIEVTPEASDSAQLLPALERIERRLKQKPQQMVADGGYTTCQVIQQMAERGVDFLGNLGRDLTGSGITAPHQLPPRAFLYEPETNRLRCPEGKLLRPQGRWNKGPGTVYHRYEAEAEDCLPCPRKPECCPGNERRGRSVMRLEESATLMAFRQKMASAEAQQRYRWRARVVEFCHAWIKCKLGLRQFHVRGRIKARAEVLWACLTYNLQQWIRLRRLTLASAAG